jgi:adenosylhomocysteine nucleosidase
VNAVGVVTALAAEARQLSSSISRHASVVRLDDGTLVAVGGVGPDAATRTARRLLDAGATALVSWGLAGGLDPSLRAGTVFLPDRVLAIDGPALATSAYWVDGLQAGIAGNCQVARGTLLTSPRAIGAVADKAAAWRSTGAGAVDMESHAVGRAALSRGLPFIAVRVIIDAAHDAVPASMLAALGDSGQLRIGRLLAALATAPADILALIRLGQRYRAATGALGAVARSGSMAAGAFAASAAHASASSGSCGGDGGSASAIPADVVRSTP